MVAPSCSCTNVRLRDSQTRSATMSIARSSEISVHSFERGARYFIFVSRREWVSNWYDAAPFGQRFPWLIGDSESPSIETSLPSLWKINWPHPTPQYGQIERATSASSMRACIACVFSDIASRPVPSLRSRIWRRTGHFETEANIQSISLHFGAADNPGLKKMVRHLQPHWCGSRANLKPASGGTLTST